VVVAVVFWLGLAHWARRDARRRIRDPFLVFLATLLGLALPYIGPAVYLLFRPSETLDDLRSRRVELQALEQQLARPQPACPICSSSIEPDYMACPVCTTVLRRPCATCNAPPEPLWQLCPYCATPIELSPADLDAALTGETRTIALADHTVPHESHAGQEKRARSPAPSVLGYPPETRTRYRGPRSRWWRSRPGRPGP
jgi:double zinc ribbon protein